MAISRAPLGHRHPEGVVDDEHPDEEREQARGAHHHRKRCDHRLEVLAATGRRLNLKSRTEERLQIARALGDGRPGFSATSMRSKVRPRPNIRCAA